MEKDTRRWIQALSYPLWPVALICLIVVDDKDKLLQYHVRQGLVFGLVVSVIFWILSMVFWLFLWWLLNILWLLAIIVAIMYAVKAYKDERFKVPIVYDVAKKIWKDM